MGGFEPGLQQEILTVEEAAGFLRVSPSSIYKMAQEGKIPCRKAGRQWRFSRSALLRWIEQSETKVSEAS